MYVVIFRIDNEYRRRKIRETLSRYGLREAAGSVFILATKSQENEQLFEAIRKIMNYYDAKHVIFGKGSRFILVMYRFFERNSKKYMSTKRILERNLALYISRGVYILPSEYSYIISELYKNVGYLEYFYVEPISKIDESQLSQMYIEYINNIVDKLMAKKMHINNRRMTLELLRYTSILQEKIMDLAFRYIIDQNSIISILKKLGMFKLEVLKKLQNL